jgi:hypothetical protein
MDRIPSVVDHEKDKKKAKWILLKSANDRDFEANQGKASQNSISIREISNKNTGQGFDDYLDVTKEMDMAEDPLIIIIGERDDGVIKITNTGRNYFEENRNQDFTQLEF